jgi:competence protein ComEC
LNKIINRIPFLRLTAAVAAGILSGSVFYINGYFLGGILLVVAGFLLWVNFKYKYNIAQSFGVGVHLFFFCTGILLYQHYNKKPEFYENGMFKASVIEILQEKPKSYQSMLQVNAFLRNDSVFSVREKVIVYFAKDTNSLLPEPGQVIVFGTSPQMIKHNGNPFEFDYKGYMAKRKVYRQVYLSSHSWERVGQSAPLNLTVFAEQVRKRLLDIYNQQKWEERQLQVISALTLGYRRGLDPETKRVFASAGVLHVLAVSGLHTGILFLILKFLFGFLRTLRQGKFIFVFLVIASLWGFALLTGLSPSVNRAAAMFSFVVIGQNLRRQINTYNTLAASAFFLLLINPNNIFEAGFQLSYAAVFGIVFLHPRFDKLIYFRLKISRYFWSLFSLSVAAQIATFPISVFYFHQFPVYFWLANLVAIPAVTVLIPLGIALLAFNWFSLLSSAIAYAAGFGLNVLISFLEMVDGLPVSTATLYFSQVEFWIIMAFIISTFIFIEHIKKIYLKSSLVLLFLFFAVSLGIKTYHKISREVIVYNYPGQHVVHLIAGRHNYVVSERAINKTDNIGLLINNTVAGLQMSAPKYLTCGELFHDSFLYLNKGFIYFEGTVLHYYHDENRNDFIPFEPDIIICNPATGRSMMEKNSINTFIAKMNENFKKPVIIYDRGEKEAFRRKM